MLKEGQLRVTYGGWYQRTTLHLSEVHFLFMGGESKLNLSKEKLKKLHKSLHLVKVSREPGYFEYVRAVTESGIEIRYYEDGLYTLEIITDNAEDIDKTHQTLEDYFQTRLQPALSYIFSRGAPTPKQLANIKTVHPVVVSFREKENSKEGNTFKVDESIFGEVYSKITSNNLTVYKTPKYIFISASTGSTKSLVDLIGMQIFFREFKDQLEKYLHIHRTIWEEISTIKEAKVIKGKDVETLRGKLDTYQKTINLISNRINQMGSYVSTRSSIAKHLEIEKDLVQLFEYKFETLTDTLTYIKEIWKMTGDYLASAIANMVEIKNQSTSNNLKSLQTITSIGVISGVLGYLSASKLPSISFSGLIYFIILFGMTWLMNYVIIRKYKNKEYSLKFGERAKNL
ncbi:MAG TPA: hypothetical protein VGO63_03290 [Candidatus Paceibacterota bacterium]|nr:hypothetical protein [Candidatus Paceibacterota bacterium]